MWGFFVCLFVLLVMSLQNVLLLKFAHSLIYPSHSLGLVTMESYVEIRFYYFSQNSIVR